MLAELKLEALAKEPVVLVLFVGNCGAAGNVAVDDLGSSVVDAELGMARD